MKGKRGHKRKRKRNHKPWRTSRDDFILRIYGWGKMNNYTRGFNVVFPRLHGFPQKYFSVMRYGSERAALDAARAHRDKLFAASGEPERRKDRSGVRRVGPFMVKRRKNNTSGVVGVSLSKRDWLASFHPRLGKEVRRSWSIKKYTYEGARMLAIAWRNEVTAKLRNKR